MRVLGLFIKKGVQKYSSFVLPIFTKIYLHLERHRWGKNTQNGAKANSQVKFQQLGCDIFWISNGKTRRSPTVARSQGSGTKLTSGASSRTKPARLSDGEGEARRKAGLVECSESLLLPLLKGASGQGAPTDRRVGCCAQPAEAGASGESTAELEPSRPIGVVFGVPGRHRS